MPSITNRGGCFALAVFSLAALGFAFVSQYGFGYAPCELCVWQRLCHGAVVLLGTAALASRRERPGLIFQCVGVALCLAVSIFHIGVESHLWAGSRECVGDTSGGNDLAGLTKQILSAPVVRCDEIRWSFLGLSMAVWDAILCLAMLIFGLAALRRRR